ncbi:MAG: RidA family protein [Oscillospiraceae bacterium]
MTIRRFEANGRYSKVVEHGGIIYISGQTCSDPKGDIKQQTAEVLEKIDAILEKYGSDREHLLTATIYIKDMTLFKDMNSVWDNWVIPDNEPVRACVEAKLAASSLLVEVVCSAALK